MFCCNVHILLHLFSQCEFIHSSALLVQFDKYLFILERTSVSELSVSNVSNPTQETSCIYAGENISFFSDNMLLYFNASKLCVKWNEFQEKFEEKFGNHREHNEFADVTLACEDGQHIEAHKVVLAVSSAFFQTLPK